MNFLLGKKHLVKHQKITAHHKEQTSEVHNFSTLYGKTQDPGVIEILP